MGSGYLGGGPYLPYATTAASVTLTDEHYMMTATANGITITLPPSNRVAIGRIFVIKSINLSEGGVTVGVTGTDHIDGGTSSVLTAYQSIVVQSNGNGTWYIIANF